MIDFGFASQIARDLPDIQALAESNMPETLEIVRASGSTTDGEGVVTARHEVVWAGPGRITQRVTSGFYDSHPDAAGHILTVDMVGVKIPVSAVGKVLVNDRINVIESLAGNQGRSFSVEAVKGQSQGSSLLLVAEEITAGR